jgi:hypothetical protein
VGGALKALKIAKWKMEIEKAEGTARQARGKSKG